MTTRRELGTISQNEGLITYLEFHKSSHLFCGTEKGDILIWKANHWQQYPSLTGHTDRINSISVHPSGVLALSTSKDKTLKLWNLKTGQISHTNKLAEAADMVKWAPDGQHYLLISDNKIVLYSSVGTKINKMSEPKKILTSCWIDSTYFCTGGEDQILNIWKIDENSPTYAISKFSNRIKGISTIQKPEKWDSHKFPFIITISSDQYLKIWDIEKSLDIPVQSIFTDFRLISLCASLVPTTNLLKFSNKSSKKRDLPVVSQDDQINNEKNQNENKKYKIVPTKSKKPDGTPLKSILKKSKVMDESKIDKPKTIKKRKILNKVSLSSQLKKMTEK